MKSKRFLTRILFLLAMSISFGTLANKSPLTDSIQLVEENNTSKHNIESISITEKTFHNVSAKAIEEGVKITWSLDYSSMDQLKEEGYQLFIQYNTKIGDKRLKNGYNDPAWIKTDFLGLETTSFEIENLVGNESYVFKLGLVKNEDFENSFYSKKGKFKTKRGWGIAKLLILIGALAFFIYGMKVMSEGLQQAAGSRLRKLLGLMTKNRFTGIFTGFFTTAVVQSSSVTTVMTVSFVNAGLMNLRQSAGVMLGANIGTTITGWLILLVGFKVSIGSYAYIIMAILFPLLFLKKAKTKAMVNTIFGFCILFLGLAMLKETVPNLSKDNPMVLFFTEYKDVWFGPILFVLLGTVVTIVVQSSSAAMTLTLTMVSAGLIPFEVACAMILGENIGTTITAELASLVANVHAKRSARIHSLFNIIGVIWMLAFMIIGKSYFIQVIGYFVSLFTGEPFNPENTEMSLTGITLFHTLFNTMNVLIMVWFIPQLVKMAERTVKSRGDADEEFHLDFIGGGILTSPEVALIESKKEVAKFGNTTSRMNSFVRTILNSSDKKEKQKMFNKLKKYEEITDRVEIEITEYLSKASRLEMSEEASMRTRGMMNITTDLERIGDIYYQMGKALEKKENEKIWFSPEQRDGLNHMLDLLKKSFETMNDNLNAEYGSISIIDANERERDINQFRNELRRIHLANVESEEYNMASGLIFANLFASCEKVGDHIINVSEAVAGEYAS